MPAPDRPSRQALLQYAIVILFVATWIVALLVWRYGRIEERWTSQLATPGATAVEQES